MRKIFLDRILTSSRFSRLKKWSPRFETDPDRGGVEKLAISPIQVDMLASPIKQFKVADFCSVEAGSLGPMSLFHVKGWSRSVAAIACMLHAYTMPEAFQVQY